MRFRCRLERLVNGQALLTDVVEGETSRPPEVGSRFLMEGRSLDPAADFRLVHTSVVQRVVCHGWPTSTGEVVYDFDTENSTYRLTLLPDAPDETT